MATCSSCGAVATDDAHFCPRCGASMTAPPPPQPSAAQSSWSSGPPLPPPSGPPQYPYQYAGARPPQTTNAMAVASLILGIVTLCGIGSVLAVIFGYIGKAQIDNSGGTQSGRGMAIAGIVLGWIGIAAIVILIVVAIIGAATDSGSSQQSLTLL